MATNPSKLSQFWQELKRRKVLPFLIAYLTACVAIIELSSNASETFSLSKETVKLLYLLSAIGIPVVILLPWIINRKKTEDIGELIEHQTETPKNEENKPLHNLPVQLTTFIGREKETSELYALVENNRLITITGAGGCGKTRISLQIAREYLDKFSDGVWFVDLAPLEDPGLLPQELANSLSITEEPGKPIASTLKEQIREKHCMLLLDNCEHLVDATADLAQQLLSSSPDLKILATSREALKINGEVLWTVPSLSLPEKEDQANLEKLEHSEAIRLFLDRARNSKPGFQLNEENASTISQICHQVDGIPLATEMAAARIRHMEPKMILERIQNRFQLLSSDRRTSISRQKTLKATLDWSYDLLSDKEKLLFTRLSVFAAGFLAETAEEICSDDRFARAEVLDTLSNLVDKSMMVIKSRQEGSVRYGMLETLKEYAAEKLSDAGEKEFMDKRHYDFFLSILDRAFEERIEHGTVWAGKIEAEQDEYLKATGWAEKDPKLFLKITGGLGWFWEARSHYGLGVQKLKQALDGFRDQSAYTARALTAYGSFGLWLGEFAEEATASLNEALSIWSAIGNKLEIGHLHNWLGAVKATNNEIESSMHHYQKAYSIFGSLRDPKPMVLTKFGMGYGHVCSFEPDKAEPMIEEALAEAIKFDMKREIGMARHVYADCALLRKDYSVSFERYKMALKACMQAKDYGQAIAELMGIALSLAGKSFYKDAITLNSAVLSIFEQLGVGDLAPEFWIHCTEETIGKAKKEVAEALVKQYEEEGIAMGFDKAVEYALDFELE
jgi:non-specific serine/threonine protein kinase